MSSPGPVYPTLPRAAWVAPEAAREILREMYPNIVEARICGVDATLCAIAWPSPTPSEFKDLERICEIEERTAIAETQVGQLLDRARSA